MNQVITTAINVIIVIVFGCIATIILSWLPMLTAWALGYGLHRPFDVWIFIAGLISFCGIIAIGIDNETNNK